MNILFVCTGNTCRSPMAEAICNMLARNRGLDVIADSAGIFAHPGDDISPHAAGALLSLWGIDFYHSSKQVTSGLLNKADLVVAMTAAHRDILLKLTGFEGRLITMPHDISDPFGSSAESYAFCAQEIYSGLNELISSGVIA